MSLKRKKKNQQLLKAASLSGVGIQMGVTIYLGVFIGEKLDSHFNSEKQIFTIIFTLLALVISIYSVIRQLDRIGKKYD
jgi:F0F1-type ATP synthase assembly protein I